MEARWVAKTMDELFTEDIYTDTEKGPLLVNSDTFAAFSVTE
jgi:hypothetical protein